MLAQGSSVCALASLDHHDDDDQGHGQDHEDDGYEGDQGGAQGDEEGRWQDREEGRWQEECPCHEEEGCRHFAPKKLSDALAAICGGKTMPRTEVTKKIWVYIKKNSLNQGRTIKPDAKLKAIFPVAIIDMLKMAGYVSKHLS